MSKLLLLASIILFALSLTPAMAQVSGVTVVNNLAFGDIFPGIPKEISEKTPGQAAEFSISGVAGSEVQIDFTLPTYMNNVGYNMQLIFKDTDCSLDSSASADQTAPLYADQNPWKAIVYGIGSGGISIWLGGKAVPKLKQAEGSYSADIVITVTYISK